MKGLYSIVAFVFFSLVLSACQSNGELVDNNDSQSKNGVNDEVIELRMAWWGGQERHDRTLEVIEMYEDQNPHIKIVPEYSGYDGYFDKLTTQFVGENAPDIIQYDGSNIHDFVNRNVVLSLEDYVGDVLDVSLHDEDMVEAATINDNLYGVGLGTSSFGILLNKTLFDEAGVSLPSKDWTWDEYIETATKISEALENIGGTAYLENDGFELFINQNGKVLHENGELQIEKEDVLAWFELWEKIRETGAVVGPEIQAASSNTPEQSMIIQREVAMQIGVANQLGAFVNATEDEIVMHNFPYNELGSHGTYLGATQFLAGYSKTKHPEEVAKFLNFFVNDEEATAILGSDRGVPVNSKVREQLAESSSEVDQEIFSFIDFISETSDSPFVPNLPGDNEATALFEQVSEEIAFGQLTIEEGTDYYWKDLLDILEKNKN